MVALLPTALGAQGTPVVTSNTRGGRQLETWSVLASGIYVRPPRSRQEQGYSSRLVGGTKEREHWPLFHVLCGLIYPNC